MTPSELKLVMTEDGSHTLYSTRFDSCYHSTHGALQESRHIFIEAGLDHYSRLHPGSTIHLLETGFGTGLNALLSLQYASLHERMLFYLALEKYPIGPALAASLNYPDVLQRQDLRGPFLQMHDWKPGKRKSFGPYFTLACETTDFLDFEPGEERFDVIFFDPFSFDSCSEHWEHAFLKRIVTSLRPEGVLVSYGARGAFKRSLNELNCQVESLPGPPGKREITRATKA